jgi:hypothetical protein
MDSIFKLIKDPSWWFTAVFIAILASVAASYFRDGISSVAARMSKVLRARRVTRLANESSRILFLAAHPSLLLMEMLHTTLLFICFLSQVGMYLMLPAFINIVSNTPELMRFDFFSPSPDTFRKVNLIWVPIMGVSASYWGIRVVSRLRVVVKAMREYEGICKRNQNQNSTPPNTAQDR